MPLHPQSAKVIEAANAAGGTMIVGDVEETRRRYQASIARMAPPTPELAGLESLAVPGPAGPVPVRVYRPRAEGTLPLVVFCHGGGWMIGNLDSHDAVCRLLADRTPAVVVSVDYRLAPEHPFPAAVDDCWAATCWAAERAADWDADGRRLGVAGDSAGGNLAAVMALKAREAGGPAIGFQALVYPAVDHTADTESKRRNGEGYLLTAEAIAWCSRAYLGEGDWRDPLASPLLASSHAGLPPALVATAEFDPLLDEGRAYADALAAAGVAVEYTNYPGMLHGFIRMGTAVDDSWKLIDQTARALREGLAAPAAATRSAAG